MCLYRSSLDYSLIKMSLKKINALLKHFAQKTLQKSSFDQKLLEATELVSVDESGLLKVDYLVPVFPELCSSSGTLHTGCISTIVDEFTTFSILGQCSSHKVTVSVDLSVAYSSLAFSGEQLLVKTANDCITENLAYSSAKLFVGSKLIASGKHTKFIVGESEEKAF